MGWDDWLDQAVFAYNTSVHESTGISPYEMVFGRKARMPVEVELGVPLRSPTSQSDYARSLRKAIHHSNQLTQRHLQVARSQQTTQYNSRSKKDWQPFEPGQDRLFGFGVPSTGSLVRGRLGHTLYPLEKGSIID